VTWASERLDFIARVVASGLLHTVLKLSDLVIDFGRGDLREELPALTDRDIDIALRYVAALARA